MSNRMFGKGEKKPIVSAAKLVTDGAWPGVCVRKTSYGIIHLSQKGNAVCMSMEQARVVASEILNLQS